jgi:hypothetical protein
MPVVADFHPLNKEQDPHPSDPDPKQSEKWIWIRIKVMQTRKTASKARYCTLVVHREWRISSGIFEKIKNGAYREWG